MRRFASAAAFAATLLAAGTAQAVNFGTGTYTENFNTLAATGTGTVMPAGFTFSEFGSSAANNDAYAANTGSSTAGDTYSYGSAGSSDRAFGMLQSGTFSSQLDAQFTNATGATVTALALGYVGEMWRLGNISGRLDRIAFSYSLDNGTTYNRFDTLDFVTPNTTGTAGARDGNLAENRTVINGVLSGLSLTNGASIYFRWFDTDATGADDGLAVDDFSLTPTLAATPGAVPEPATWGMMLLGFGLLGSALRRRRVAVVAA